MGKDTPFLSSKNIKICGQITKLEVIICNLFAFSSISAEYLQKFEYLMSQGIVATCLRWDGRCCMSFVANFIRFPAVKKFWESVKIWQSYREFKGGNFFDTQCRIALCEILDWHRICCMHEQLFNPTPCLTDVNSSTACLLCGESMSADRGGGVRLLTCCKMAVMQGSMKTDFWTLIYRSPSAMWLQCFDAVG